jgi:hypothetical protein
MFARVIQIEVHLPGIRVGELSEFEINDDEASKSSMEEEQVNPVPLVSDAQPMLASDKREVTPEFQQKGLQLPYQGILKFGF